MTYNYSEAKSNNKEGENDMVVYKKVRKITKHDPFEQIYCKPSDTIYNDIEDIEDENLVEIPGLWSEIEGQWEFDGDNVRNIVAEGRHTAWIGEKLDEAFHNYEITAVIEVEELLRKND